MATPLTLSAHVVVEFGDQSNVQAVVEVDSREDGYNQGRTSFSSGDDAYLLLFVPKGYDVVADMASVGTLSYVGLDSKAVEDYLTYANEDQATVQYPITTGFSAAWYGSAPSPSITVKSDDQTVALSARPYDPVSKKLNPEYRIGVARVNYSSACRVYKISNVPANIPQVIAFFVLKKTTT